MQRRRRSWVIGGTALIVCGVLSMLSSSFLGTPAVRAIAIAGDVAWAVGVLSFAIGLAREQSLVARKPLGTVALVIVALWPVTSSAIGAVLESQRTTDPAVWSVLGYVGIVVPIAAGLIATVQIGRIGVAPHPWRWAPLWVLAGQAALWVMMQVAYLVVPGDEVQLLAGPLAALGTLTVLAATLGLGILALVLAARTRPESVEVYAPGAH